MAEADPPLSRISQLDRRLTDKEREILRLLASGHTVKSIAAQLARSEASINERLREARRKTGIGSSRELARLLDTQTNRDRKIDLAAQQAEADVQLQPTPQRRGLPKGAILMLTTLILAAAGYAAAVGSNPQPEPAPAAIAATKAASPLAGTWSLDIARIPAAERPREVTIEFREGTHGDWLTKVRIVSPNGEVMQGESSASFDGKAVPVSGNMPFVDAVSLRRPAPGTLVMTLSKGGTPVSTRVYTVARNGRSMTETIVWGGQDVPKLETTYFNRVD